MRISANLGFLWADLSLPDAIFAAKRAAFDAVECYCPYNAKPNKWSRIDAGPHFTARPTLLWQSA